MKLESPASGTIADLSERDLIARIQQRLPPAPPWMLVGIGDDAAVIEPERNRVEVLTVDALVEGVHFDRTFVPADAIGYRALAVNLSDLAAMGAEPRTALLSLALPPALPLHDFDAMADGLTRLAAEHRLHIAGGNLTRSPGPLLLDVTVIGTVKRRQAMTRTGARAGDEMYVSGTIGTAAVGLGMLKAKRSTTEDTEELTRARSGLNSMSSTSSVSSVSSVVAPFIKRYLYPEPRVRLGLLLGRNRAATACIDLSDGLVDGVRRIAEASGLGATIDGDAIPVDPAACAWFKNRGGDGLLEAITAGDDYELLFTVPPRNRKRLAAAAQRSGVALTRVGVCTKDPALVLSRTMAGRAVVGTLPLEGYQHFR